MPGQKPKQGDAAMEPKKNDKRKTDLTMRERMKIICDRMEAIRYPHDRFPMSSKVKAAYRLVSKYEVEHAAYRDNQRAAWSAKRRAIQDAMILGDIPFALRLLQDAEKEHAKDRKR